MNSFKYLKSGLWFANLYSKYNEKSAHVWLGIVLRQFRAVLTTLRQFTASAVPKTGLRLPLSQPCS